LLDQEERVEREEDRVAAEYLGAGSGQLQLLSRKERISPWNQSRRLMRLSREGVAPIVATDQPSGWRRPLTLSRASSETQSDEARGLS
jgi:hypothetical protein